MFCCAWFQHDLPGSPKTEVNKDAQGNDAENETERTLGSTEEVVVRRYLFSYQCLFLFVLQKNTQDGGIEGFGFVKVDGTIEIGGCRSNEVKSSLFSSDESMR